MIYCRSVSSLLLLSGLAISLFESPEAFAQSSITPDDTLGAQSAQVQSVDATTERIDGGALRDTNLFHSFLDFNVGANQQVYFSNPAAVENIFSRVTGGSVSNILGTLGVDGPANLFFLNPKGIVFGEDASLDIAGSFLATTADAIAFQDGTQFSAIAPRTNSPLTVSIPLGLQPAPTGGTIENSGVLSTAQGLTLVAEGLNLNGQLSAGEDLTLRANNPINGDSQYQSGGNFRVETAAGTVGDLNSPGGTVIRAGGSVAINDYAGASLHILAGGSVDVNSATVTTAAQNTALGENTLQETIALSDGTTVEVAGAVQPTIDIRAGMPGATVSRDPSDDPSGNELNADINATKLLIDAPNGLIILNNQFELGPTTGDINITGTAIGDGVLIGNVAGRGGDIFLQSQNNVTVLGALVFANSAEQAGTVFISADDDVRFNTLGDSGFSPTGVFSSPATLGTIGGDSGNVRIRANNLDFSDGAFISTSAFQVSGNAGDIIIDVAETARFDGVGIDPTTRLPFAVSGALTNVGNSGSGNAGNIRISAKNLEVIEGARLITSVVQGTGTAGDIVINATETVRFEGRDRDTELRAFAASNLQPGTAGQGGNILITSESIELLEGGQLNSATQGVGDAGSITLNSSGVTLIDEGSIFSSIAANSQGTGGDIRINAGALAAVNGGQIISNSAGVGNAGDIVLTVSGETLFDGINADNNALSVAASNILASGQGNGGDILITTSDLTLTDGGQLIANSLGQGDAGNIDVTVGQTALFSGVNARSGDSSGVATTLLSGGQGAGGNIQISARDVVIEDLAQISANSSGDGNAGNITFDVVNQFLATEGQLSTGALGNLGGNITLNARSVQLNGNSNILTAATGENGNGGNVTIAANSVVAFDDSDILAFSQRAQGGNITINSPAFFGENYQPSDSLAEIAGVENNQRVDINASGVFSGTISLPDVSFIQNDLVELPDTVVDANTLIAGSCIARSGEAGSFVVSGGGGLSARPGDGAIASYPIGEIRRLQDNAAQANLTEPQGVFQLADGRLVMSRSCD
ncbi:MAG: filamentous hemagglutinin N-terminal domain-containing protein [Cyanobacteria bacterium J06597_16]